MTSASPSFGLGQIGQIALPARDLERAIAFYRDKLGLRFLFQAPPALAFFDCAGVRLLIDVPQDPEFQRHGSVIYFSVPDIRSAHEILSGRGVKFEDAPHIIASLADRDVWMTFFRDTEDNMLALMSEVVRS
jgi:methylmalonyl-CoA/ethylmalonyl-CoA epimerase